MYLIWWRGCRRRIAVDFAITSQRAHSVNYDGGVTRAGSAGVDEVVEEGAPLLGTFSTSLLLQLSALRPAVDQRRSCAVYLRQVNSQQYCCEAEDRTASDNMFMGFIGRATVAGTPSCRVINGNNGHRVRYCCFGSAGSINCRNSEANSTKRIPTESFKFCKVEWEGFHLEGLNLVFERLSVW